VSSEDQLAVIEKANLLSDFQAIQPDAQFLFRKTIDLNIKIYNTTSSASHVDGAAFKNPSPDPFAVILNMPDLQKLVLRFHESVKRIDLFTPSLPKLRNFSLYFWNLIEFDPTAFNHLDGLESLDIGKCGMAILEKFETGLAPRYIQCFGVKLLKLNSVDVAKIKIIETKYIVDSLFPLNGLEKLSLMPNDTIELHTFCLQFSCMRILTLDLSDLSQVNRGQLSCLSKLTDLKLLGNIEEKYYTASIINKILNFNFIKRTRAKLIFVKNVLHSLLGFIIFLSRVFLFNLTNLV
jgi:hypothetical protein